MPVPRSVLGKSSRRTRKVIHIASQRTDEDGPCLPPDLLNSRDLSKQFDRNTLSRLYRTEYSKLPSARRGCRHYVKGFLHKNFDPNVAWIIDPYHVNAIDLHVTVHITCSATKAAVHRMSVVHQLRYLPGILGNCCNYLLDDIHVHCNDVKKNGSGGARAGMGDQGLMHPIGTHINISGDMVRYRTSSDAPSIPLLAKAVAASATIAAVTIPGVLRLAQDLEKDSAMIPVQGSMDGDGKFAHVGHSMDLSVNLSNSSHYDVNDGCQGFSIWTEDNPGSTKNLYFILPNVEGQFPNSDRKFSGIAIALRHGVLISRDRRLLRHCTSHIESRTGNVYGSFFAAKSRIVKHGMQRALRAGEIGVQPRGEIDI